MLIVSNWKAYVSDLTKAKKLLEIAKRYARKNLAIVLAPPAPLLGLFSSKGGSVGFAAQDISLVMGGAVTGEITAEAYALSGATYALVGHSERRALGDTDNIVTEKLARALSGGLIPILCVGEEERDLEGRYLSVIREQLTTTLSSLSPKELSRVVVAYEPLWAIGKTASAAIKPNDLTEMVLYIRKVLSELLPEKASAKNLVLYGGSTEPENAKSLSHETGVDGFLVGHASAEPESYALLLKELS